MSDIVTSVYGGRATLTFSESRHTYTVDVPSKGITKCWQPSVTSVIRTLDKSDILIPWAIKKVIEKATATLKTASGPLSYDLVAAVLDSSKTAHSEFKEEAGDIGTFVHGYFERELKQRAGVPLPVSSAPDTPEEYKTRVANAVSAGQRFFDDHDIRLIHGEEPRWSPRYGFAGTGDAIGLLDGKPAIWDYKTGKRLYDTVFLQLAAYQMAYEEEYPDEQLEYRVGINVSKDGVLSHEVRDRSTLKTDFDCFLGLLTAWRWNRENQGPQWSKPAPKIVGSLYDATPEETYNRI